MDDDASKNRRLSRKALARELRRQAYQRAKEWRATDRRQIAMKEAIKQRRKEMYQRAKARRKEAAEEEVRKREAKRVEERAVADDKLMKMVSRFTEGGG